MPHLHVEPWSIAPFALLLLCIAILPLCAAKWWHHNFNKALVSFGLALPAVVYVLYLQFVEDQPGLVHLEHSSEHYIDFIVMMAALYTVAGGIALEGRFPPTPLVNVIILAAGAVLANIIGTTGASMLLIRPFLRINLVRQNRTHLPIFFILLISNLGGLLTPLGDPPLFLGFLAGVDFFWTLSLWPHWALTNGVVLGIAWTWDMIAYAREPNRESFPPRHGSFVIGGPINFLFLLGILAAVLCQSPDLLGLPFPLPSMFMGAMAFLSWFFTPSNVRAHNQFSWEAIIEVAVLFAGIFATMVPALALLKMHGGELGVTERWHYFWLTGLLSAALDNAPTYLTFATLASGEGTIAALSINRPDILQAISAGAVFMGALTYIGNGPNFMVKSIAESAGYTMPSFFGYAAYSGVILLPVFVLVTWVFFV